MKTKMLGIPGRHYWATYDKHLVVVLCESEQHFSVCGKWEGSIAATSLNLISEIPRPQGFEKTKLYYL